VGVVTFEERVHALEPLGLTPRQTRFVVTVALHGGYCLRRQYQAFAGVSYGSVVRDFLDALVSRQLATRFSYRRNRGHLYHLHATALYRALQQDDNRNRRAASPAQIARKLMLLDYVLSQSDVEWYATEDDKVALFRDRFAIPQCDLPQRMYTGARGREDDTTIRYFVHKEPIGVMADGARVQFVHVVTDVHGRTLAHFLRDHRGLVDQLPAWAVVAVCPRHISGLPACQRAFDEFVQQGSAVADAEGPALSWYFATRRKVENDEVRQLSMADITRFRETRKRLASGVVEAMYRRWLTIGDAALTESDGRSPAMRQAPPRLVLTALPGRYDQFGSLAGVC
jgi:hypothetical protein